MNSLIIKPTFYGSINHFQLNYSEEITSFQKCAIESMAVVDFF